MFLCSACSNDDEVDDRLQMPVFLSIAADDPGLSHRAPGDPGADEGLQLPRYLYVYFVERLKGDDGALTENAALDRLEEQLDPDLWTYDPASAHYVYGGHLVMFLSHKEIAATAEATDNKGGSRVYAIASYSPLTFDGPQIDGAIGTLLGNVESMQLDLTKNADPNFDLMNVYATPVGDTGNGEVSKTGAFLYETTVTCYHVAARVDFQWNINPDKQQQFALKQIDLLEVPKVGYFFQHTKNPPQGAATSTLTFKTTPGNQWFGRHVFHVFDKNVVNCKYTVEGVTDPFSKVYTPGETGSSGTSQDVFANWYRINVSFGY